MPFPPSAACRFFDLPPVNLQNLPLHLTKNSFASAPTHLCGIALTLCCLQTALVHSKSLSEFSCALRTPHRSRRLCQPPCPPPQIKTTRHLAWALTSAGKTKPIPSYSSGEGVWGRGASLREAASPPESPLPPSAFPGGSAREGTFL